MSVQERLRDKRRLGELREKAAQLKFEIEELRDFIRFDLDEFEKIENLKLSQVVGNAVEAAALQVTYVETLDTITAIEKALG